MMRTALASFLLALAACGPTVTVSILNQPTRVLTRHSIGAVRVYATGAPEGMVDVYLIEVSGGDPDSRMPTLRERAAALGCDGLVLNGNAPDRATSAVAIGRPMVVASNTAGYLSAVCVVAPFVAPAGPPSDAPQ